MSLQRQESDRLDYKTLCDAVFFKLRDEILEGTLRPGQKLLQTDLAVRFCISRMPVRDALRKLEAEGLVTVNTGRGAIVAALDMDEFRDVYRIREVLEEMAAMDAVPHMVDRDIATLKELEEQMKKAAREGDLGLWLQLDSRFHIYSFQPCRNPRLLKLIVGFWNSTHHFRRAYCGLPGKVQAAEQTHQEMVTSMETGNAELFARLTREHIRETVRAIMEAHLMESAAQAEEIEVLGEPCQRS